MNYIFVEVGVISKLGGIFFYFLSYSPLFITPSGGPYCITDPVVLAYIQSLPELCLRLRLVADIVISCSVVVVV